MYMKNEIIETEDGCYTYIDCQCTSFDHLCKLSFYIDDYMSYFYLEFKHESFPIINGGIIKDNFFVIKKIYNYLTNIWYAIKGKPNTYTNIAYWDFEQANKINDFINHCLVTYKDNTINNKKEN